MQEYGKCNIAEHLIPNHSYHSFHKSDCIETAWKVSKYGVFSSPYFPAFGLNTKKYGVPFRIQSEYGKIRTRKNSVYGHFSRSEI